MKQYCRYCVFLTVNNFPYCSAKSRSMKESTAKRANNCKLFVMANCEAEYQDAFGETRGYSPRDGKRNKRNDGEQVVFWR